MTVAIVAEREERRGGGGQGVQGVHRGQGEREESMEEKKRLTNDNRFID